MPTDRKDSPRGPDIGHHCSKGKTYEETEQEESGGKREDRKERGHAEWDAKQEKKKKTPKQHKRRKAVLFYSERSAIKELIDQ